MQPQSIMTAYGFSALPEKGKDRNQLSPMQHGTAMITLGFSPQMFLPFKKMFCEKKYK
nr:hypothetical protein [Listeria grayi]